MDKRDEDLFGFEEEQPRQEGTADGEEVLTIESFEEEPEPSSEAFDFVEEEDASDPVMPGDAPETDEDLFDTETGEPSADENDTPGWARISDVGEEDGASAQVDEDTEAVLFGAEEPGVPPVEDESSEQASPVQSRRLLVLALLLVVAAAGAGWFLMTSGQDEPVPVAGSTKIPIQPPPSVVKEQKEVATETMAPKPVAAVEPHQNSEQKQQSTVSETAREVSPTVSTETSQSSEAAPAPVKPVVASGRSTGPTDTPSQNAGGQVSGQKKAVAAPSKSTVDAAPAGGEAVASRKQAAKTGYMVRAGAFVLPANLKTALKTVRQLGLEPRVESVPMVRPMIRLRYGTFSNSEAPAELVRIRKKLPSAFIIYHDDKADIFAGSFVSLDKARRYADILWEKYRLRLEEVRTEVAVPVRRVSVGPVADHTEADKVAEKLKKAGLEGAIVKNGK